MPITAFFFGTKLNQTPKKDHLLSHYLSQRTFSHQFKLAILDFVKDFYDVCKVYSSVYLELSSYVKHH